MFYYIDDFLVFLMSLCGDIGANLASWVYNNYPKTAQHCGEKNNNMSQQTQRLNPENNRLILSS